MTDLAAIVSFCTHDIRFFEKCISSLRPFCSQIIVPVCDHFYNGEPEDRKLLGRLYASYPDVTFIEFAYSETQVYGTPSQLVAGSPYWAQHWHNTSRLIGTYYLEDEIDTVLFCDVDEIFAEAPVLDGEDAIRFATYWYDRRADMRATCHPDGLLLAKRSLLTDELILNEDERMGTFHRIEGNKVQSWKQEGKPIVHHYSFVRTKEELLCKVRRWGHHWERDWESLLRKEGDVVRGYTYESVEPFWDPLTASFNLSQATADPSTRINPSEFSRMQVRAFL